MPFILSGHRPLKVSFLLIGCPLQTAGLNCRWLGTEWCAWKVCILSPLHLTHNLKFCLVNMVTLHDQNKQKERKKY